ncbi:hypothetical protein QE152_g34205 [Popillia japonica]|uniref:Uncharacterized protein n=1 Tax=Popillia japonica TaxID=7064 RepID=A0AAW1IV23_POPJA
MKNSHNLPVFNRFPAIGLNGADGLSPLSCDAPRGYRFPPSSPYGFSFPRFYRIFLVRDREELERMLSPTGIEIDFVRVFSTRYHLEGFVVNGRPFFHKLSTERVRSVMGRELQKIVNSFGTSQNHDKGEYLMLEKWDNNEGLAGGASKQCQINRYGNTDLRDPTPSGQFIGLASFPDSMCGSSPELSTSVEATESPEYDLRTPAASHPEFTFQV